MERVLLAHGAHRNLGDLAMLEAVAEKLVARLPTLSVEVIERGFDSSVFGVRQVTRCQDFTYAIDAPDHWLRRLPWVTVKAPGIHAKSTLALLATSGLGRWVEHIVRPWRVPPPLANYVSRYDALVVAGGGFLTDVLYMPLQRTCSLITAFAEQRKPVLLTGQQLGPFRWRYAQAALAATLRHVRFVGLREGAVSPAMCRMAGLEPARFAVMGDDSLALPPADPTLVHDLLQQHGCRPGEFLAFNYRIGFYTPEHTQHLHSACRILDEIAHRLCIPVLVVPISVTGSAADDVEVGKMVQANASRANVRVLADRSLTPRQVKGILGQCHGALGVSYHFCTFALSQGIPAICMADGIYYGQKADGLSDFWQEPRLTLRLPGANPSAAGAHIAEVLADQALRERLRTRAGAAARQWERIFDTRCVPALIDQEVGDAG